MIEKSEIIEIGKFQKTHALKGELNALTDVDPDFLTDNHPLILDVDGIYVPFYAESIRPKGSESYLIKLKGVDSCEEAQKLVNKTIYVLRKDIVDYYDDENLEFADDFEGYTIIDSNLGEIGEIVEVDDSTANVLFLVRDKSDNTLYIPVADEFIDEIDDDNHIVRTTLPDGLVNLNIKD
ncbi:MAG: ribosome maturation factor RimM [Muribaculaceae bacterium]|nr:ribosome maturation factor RimM [Muribaculaceae bacterium]